MGMAGGKVVVGAVMGGSISGYIMIPQNGLSFLQLRIVHMVTLYIANVLVRCAGHARQWLVTINGATHLIVTFQGCNAGSGLSLIWPRLQLLIILRLAAAQAILTAPIALIFLC